MEQKSHLHQLTRNKINRLFLLLAGFFITNAIVAEFIGIKIFSLEATLGLESFNWSILGVDNLGFSLTAGVVLWPVVFIMTDIINEYYGEQRVRFLSYLTVGLISYAFLIVFIAIELTPNTWWALESGQLFDDGVIGNMDYAFRKVMGQGLWIIVGSMVAFLIGQIVDVFTFHMIKRKTGNRMVWLRATGSTLVSQFIDSYVVLIVAFYFGSDWEFVRVLAIGTVNYIYKFGIAILLTPVIYLAHYIIDNYLGREIAEQIKTEAGLQ